MKSAPRAVRLGFAAITLLLLVGCGYSAVAAGGNVSAPARPSRGQIAASPTPELALLRASVMVTPVKEPNDYAHRNYCGAGATQVLLSAWMSPVPDIETVAAFSKLDPNRGQTGANTVMAINKLLATTTDPVIGDRGVYQGRHIDALPDLIAALQRDIGSPRWSSLFGHPAPVIVQTMTKTLPGWHGWQATHMITIYAYDLTSGNPQTETVSYTETPSARAAYVGPPTQSISLAALWAAMLAHNAAAPDDPINLIS